MITIEQAQEWYTDADPVHNFDHILRVYKLATKIAQEEGADVEIVQAAALLHDANGSSGHQTEARATHHLDSAECAAEVLRTDGWQPDRIEAVKHCIAAHRYRDNSIQPQTLEAKILFDADKLDSIGAIGAARAIAYAAGVQMPFYFPPSAQFLAEGQLGEHEPHSAYHEHVFKLGKIKNRIFTQTGKKLAEERHAFLDHFFTTLKEEWEGLK